MNTLSKIIRHSPFYLSGSSEPGRAAIIEQRRTLFKKCLLNPVKIISKSFSASDVTLATAKSIFLSPVLLHLCDVITINTA